MASIDVLRRQAQQLIDKAEAQGRELTPDEDHQLEKLLRDVRDEEGRAERRHLLDGDGDTDWAHRGRDHQPHPWRSLILGAAGRAGLKDLSPGSITVPALVGPPISEFGRPPASILDLLAGEPLTNTDRFGYVVQTLRDLAASVVAPGEVKPTSRLQLQLKEGKAEVVATVTDPINRFLLMDVRALDQWLRNELQWGIETALQAQVLTGDGVSPNLAGILPQIGNVVAGGDFIALLRQTLADLESEGVEVTAVAMNVHDAATVDLLQDQIGRYYGAGPFGSGPASLWGIPRLSSPGMPQGTAIVGDWRAAVLVTRDTLDIAWSDSVGENFERNLITFRAEIRAGLALGRPWALKAVSTAQIGPGAGEGDGGEGGEGGEGRRAAAASGPPKAQSAPRR